MNEVETLKETVRTLEGKNAELTLRIEENAASMAMMTRTMNMTTRRGFVDVYDENESLRRKIQDTQAKTKEQLERFEDELKRLRAENQELRSSAASSKPGSNSGGGEGDGSSKEEACARLQERVDQLEEAAKTREQRLQQALKAEDSARKQVQTQGTALMKAAALRKKAEKSAAESKKACAEAVEREQAAQKEVSALRETVTRLESELSGVRAAVAGGADAAAAVGRELEKRVKELEREKGELLERIATMGETAAGLSAAGREREKEVGRLQAENVRLQNEATAIRDTGANELRVLRESFNRERDAYSGKMAGYESACTRLREEQENALRRASDAEKRAEVLKKECAEKDERMKMMEREVSELKAKGVAVVSNGGAVGGHGRDQSEILDALKLKLGQKRAMVTSLQKQVYELQSKTHNYEAMESDLKAAREKEARLSASYAELQEEAERLRLEVKKAQQQPPKKKKKKE